MPKRIWILFYMVVGAVLVCCAVWGLHVFVGDASISPEVGVAYLEKRSEITFPQDMTNLRFCVRASWWDDTKWFFMLFSAPSEQVDGFIKSTLHLRRLRPYVPGDADDKRSRGPAWFSRSIPKGVMGEWTQNIPSINGGSGSMVFVDTSLPDLWTVYIEGSYWAGDMERDSK